MGNNSVAIVVTPRQRKLLEGFTRTKKAAQPLVDRRRVVLRSAADQHNEAQASELGIDRQRGRRWRHRWAREMASLCQVDSEGYLDGRSSSASSFSVSKNAVEYPPRIDPKTATATALAQLGATISAMRTNAGLSLVALAKRLETYPENVIRLESGRSIASCRTLERIANATWPRPAHFVHPEASITLWAFDLSRSRVFD